MDRLPKHFTQVSLLKSAVCNNGRYLMTCVTQVYYIIYMYGI